MDTLIVTGQISLWGIVSIICMFSGEKLIKHSWRMVRIFGVGLIVGHLVSFLAMIIILVNYVRNWGWLTILTVSICLGLAFVYLVILVVKKVRQKYGEDKRK